MEDDRVFDCNLTFVESSSNPVQSITPHQGLEGVKWLLLGTGVPLARLLSSREKCSICDSLSSFVVVSLISQAVSPGPLSVFPFLQLEMKRLHHDKTLTTVFSDENLHQSSVDIGSTATRKTFLISGRARV